MDQCDASSGNLFQCGPGRYCQSGILRDTCEVSMGGWGGGGWGGRGGWGGWGGHGRWWLFRKKLYLF